MKTWTYFQIFLDRDDLPSGLDAKAMVECSEQLLLDVIRPLIVSHQDSIHRYFFMRYFEVGSHFRLRIWGNPEDILTYFEPKLRQALAEFYARTLTPTISLTGEQIVDAGYLAKQDYKPEWDKYGGTEGVKVTEKHFQTSSEIAFALLELQRTHKVSISGLVYYFVRVIVEQIFSNELDRRIFLESYCHYWLTQSPAHPQQMMAHLEENYQKSGKKLGAIQDQYGKYVLPAWINEITSQYQELLSLETAGKLTSHLFSWYALQLAGCEFLSSSSVFRQAPLTTLSALPNYLHLIHNRVGLSLYHEMQLIYFVLRAEFDGAFNVVVPTVLEPSLLSQPPAH